MKINNIQDEIISDFDLFDNWMDKYNYLIELSKDIILIPKSKKNDENLIKGCQSKVWLFAEYKNNKLYFSGDSDAIITKGIISLLISIFNNQSCDDILNSEIYFIKKIGLNEHLSMNRSNGLISMIKQIKIYALAFKNKIT